MKEQGEATKAVAETAGKAIDAVREAGGFIAKYIDGPLEQAVGIFEDKLQYARWVRQVRMIQQSQKFLKRSGLKAPTRAVPMKLAIPIMQGAILEDDDSLQDRWAALLVNAANASFPGEVRRSYATILEQLTPLDAVIFDVLYSVPFDESLHVGLLTFDLPRSTRLCKEGEHTSPPPSDEIIVSLSNLSRLGCIRPQISWGGGESLSVVNPTVAGKQFLLACTITKPGLS